MAKQLSMWNDNDPERYSIDGGGMKRPRRKGRTKSGSKQKRTRSAATRRASKSKTARSSARPAKPKRPRKPAKQPRTELPKEREYKTKRGARYVLRRVDG